MQNLNTTNVVESAAGVALVYVAYQSAVGVLRLTQISVAGVREFRRARRSEQTETETKS